MILNGDIGAQASEFLHSQGAWMEKVVDALVATWNSAPLGQRITVGVFFACVLVLARLKPFLEGLAAVITALKGGKAKKEDD